MKKYINFLLIFILGIFSVNSCNAAEYDCSIVDGNMLTFYNFNSEHTAEKECEWKKFAQNVYQKCINEHNKHIDDFKSGKASCRKILKRKFTYQKTTNCNVLYYENETKPHGYSCSGPESNVAIEKLKKLYPDK